MAHDAGVIDPAQKCNLRVFGEKDLGESLERLCGGRGLELKRKGREFTLVAFKLFTNAALRAIDIIS